MSERRKINRRAFIVKSSLISLGLVTPKTRNNLTAEKDVIIGHGTYRYKVDMNWGLLDKLRYPVKDCHEMVYTKDKRIIMLTNETKNNVIIYNKDGKLVDSWGKTYPGAHGLTLSDEGGEEFLYITDTVRHEVIKTDLKGRELWVLPFPRESEKYRNPEEYLPTETAISAQGDLYVADGYGSQYIIQYDDRRNIKNIFGGKGKEDDKFNNAHGIAIDTRAGNEILLITARAQNKLKYFSMDGQYLSSINLHGAYICRPVINGENVFLATIWSGDGSPNSGFISILDKEDKLISAPGGIHPQYINNELSPMYQAQEVFRHPHDVCIDEDEDIYVCQWNAGSTYPIKLSRV